MGEHHNEKQVGKLKDISKNHTYQQKLLLVVSELKEIKFKRNKRK